MRRGHARRGLSRGTGCRGRRGWEEVEDTGDREGSRGHGRRVMREEMVCCGEFEARDVLNGLGWDGMGEG